MRLVRWSALGLAAALAVAGCSAAGSNAQPSPESSVSQKDAPATPAASSTTPTSATAAPAGPAGLKLNVADKAKSVPVDTLLTVTGENGAEVTDVKVTSTASGKSTAKIEGAVADGKWTANTRLDPNATYTIQATGKDASGAALSEKASFSTMTLSRSNEVFATLTPVQGGPFGVAQPVVVQFDHAVQNKAEFERNMHVTSVPAQEGTWGWMDDKTAHWRPKEYWQPGTQVSLNANLNGVNAGNGLYGQENRTLQLKIGRKQQGKVDIANHSITWEVENQSPKTYPMTAGKSGFTTRSGTKVVMEKAEGIKMESETTGIDRNSSEGYSVKVSYALRVTQSGEFIHSAPWNEGNFGKRNASHGCVGMSEEQMYMLYETAQIGDPVVFAGSDRKTEFGNGWSEWDMSYDEWKKHSALN